MEDPGTATNSAPDVREKALSSVREVDVFRVISDWRNREAYSTGNLEGYRRFCTKKIQQLRRQLQLGWIEPQSRPPRKGRNKTPTAQKKPTTRKSAPGRGIRGEVPKDHLSPANAVKYAHLSLLLAERAWSCAIATERAIGNHERPGNYAATLYIREKLYMAMKALEDFVNSNQIQQFSDLTRFMVKLLCYGLAGRCLFLKKNDGESVVVLTKAIILLGDRRLVEYLDNEQDVAGREFSLTKFQDFLTLLRTHAANRANLTRAETCEIYQRAMCELRAAEVGISVTIAISEVSATEIQVDTIYTCRLKESSHFKWQELKDFAAAHPEDEESLTSRMELTCCDLLAIKELNGGPTQSDAQEVVNLIKFASSLKTICRISYSLDSMVHACLTDYIPQLANISAFFLEDRSKGPELALDRLAKQISPESGVKLACELVNLLSRTASTSLSAELKDYGCALNHLSQVCQNIQAIFLSILLLFDLSTNEAYAMAKLASQRDTSCNESCTLLASQRGDLTSELDIGKNFQSVVGIICEWEELAKTISTKLEMLCATICHVKSLALQEVLEPSPYPPQMTDFPPKLEFVLPDPIMFDLTDSVMDAEVLQLFQQVTSSANSANQVPQGSILHKLTSIWKRE